MKLQDLRVLRRHLSQGNGTEALVFYLSRGRRIADMRTASHRLIASAYSVPKLAISDQYESLTEAEAQLRQITKRWMLDELLKDAAGGRLDDQVLLIRASNAMSRLHHYGVRLSEGFLLRLLYEYAELREPKLILTLPTGPYRCPEDEEIDDHQVY
jgi:hypothetical protein